jgi:hypothetical protein
MEEFLLLMHDDAPPGGEADNGAAWGLYVQKLGQAGRLLGGSSIGAGACFRRAGEPAPLSANLTGFVRVRAESLDDARTLLADNPAFVAGATVEIRALPRDE